jgi:hypothetical protein
MNRWRIAVFLLVPLVASGVVWLTPRLAFASCTDGEAISGTGPQAYVYGIDGVLTAHDRDLANCSGVVTNNSVYVVTGLTSGNVDYIGWREYPCGSSHCLYVYTYGQLGGTQRCMVTDEHSLSDGDDVFAADYEDVGNYWLWQYAINGGTDHVVGDCLGASSSALWYSRSQRRNSTGATGMYTTVNSLEYLDSNAIAHSVGTVSCVSDPDSTWLFESGSSAYTIDKTGGSTC